MMPIKKANAEPMASPIHHAPTHDELSSVMLTGAVGWTNVLKNTDDNKNPTTAAVKDTRRMHVSIFLQLILLKTELPLS